MIEFTLGLSIGNIVLGLSVYFGNDLFSIEKVIIVPLFYLDLIFKGYFEIYFNNLQHKVRPRQQP